MITYREAIQKDIPGLLNLYKQLHENPIEPELSVANDIFKQASESGVKYFVAEENERIIACCYIAIIPNLTYGGKSIGFIENVVTDKTYRRKGIGKKIIEMAKTYATKKNCYKVLLQSHSKRIDAHVFYESIGFDGESKKAFELRFE